MVMKKKMPHVITTASSSKNGVQVFQEKSNAPADHHWDFLDEMEAPMWVDLTLECKFAYEDKDDEWFNISHPFHQLSSRELIAAFSGLDDGCTKLDFGVEGISSPKVPTSVSKSRGKHYRSREWGKEKHKATLSKRHPVKNLSSKGSLVNFGFDKARKDESCCRKIKEQTGLRSGSDGESSLTEVAGVNCLRTVSNSADLKNHADSVALRIVESHSNSTITSEDTAQQQQRKSLEVSSQVLGHTRGLLSALRVTLRKSCVTRQASRCEVKRGRQSEGRKSSSSKSSIGSSSNPGYEGKNLTARLSKERTPESRNVMRRSHTPNDKVSVANESFASLHINQETAEAEVRHHSRCPNVLVPHKVNAYTSTAAAKAKEVKGAAGDSRFARAGKENEAGRITVVQKSSSRLRYPTVAAKAKERTIAGQCSGSLGGSKVSAERRTALSQKLSTLDKGAKGAVQAQNITKRRGLQKSVTGKLVASKERTGGRIEGKGYASAAEKVYLR